MDRIEAAEKAKALLGAKYGGMSEQRYYDCCGEDVDYYVYFKQDLQNGRKLASGSSWALAIEDLEQSMKESA